MSCATFEQLGERVIEAMQAGTFDCRNDRHLSWAPLTLDERGWDRIIGRLDAIFESLAEEQADAKVRLERSNETPILMTVGLAGFLSPQPGSIGQANLDPTIPLDLAPAMRLDSAIPFSMRLAKVFADPLNMKIVTETNLRAMSATGLRQQIDPSQSLKVFERRTKVLEGLGWVVRVDSKTGGRRRGAKEHFYRAVGPGSSIPANGPTCLQTRRPRSAGARFSSSLRKSERRCRQGRSMPDASGTGVGRFSALIGLAGSR